jgi:acylpyruvate hydrolase
VAPASSRLRPVALSPMKLATIRTSPTTTAAVVAVGDELVEVGAPDVGGLLADISWRTRIQSASGVRHALGTANFASLVTRPDKVICVGLNYRSHIEEMGNAVPEYPTLFAKFTDALIGANDPIAIPSVSEKVDWEVELGVVIGATVRGATPEQARAAIAGYTVVNDISMRDWQRRTVEFLQGKTFEHSTPVGPYLLVDEGGAVPTFDVRCSVDGVVKQSSNTSDLVFDPVELIAYCSQIITLKPGDVIATGTPGGVGAARTPPEFLKVGSVVETEVVGVGVCRNVCEADPVV